MKLIDVAKCEKHGTFSFNPGPYDAEFPWEVSILETDPMLDTTDEILAIARFRTATEAVKALMDPWTAFDRGYYGGAARFVHVLGPLEVEEVRKLVPGEYREERCTWEREIRTQDAMMGDPH